MSTEKNILIAEFMGAFPIESEYLKDYELYGIINCIEDGEDEKHFYSPEEMLFNCDWNWLMEVILMCKDNQFFGSQNLIDTIDNALLEINIAAVYEACVEFVKSYNQRGNYFRIDGYWKDNKVKFSDYIISESENGSMWQDELIFYHGLSESDILKAIKSADLGEETNLDFAITAYRKID